MYVAWEREGMRDQEMGCSLEGLESCSGGTYMSVYIMCIIDHGPGRGVGIATVTVNNCHNHE